jgi:hypothetical protein
LAWEPAADDIDFAFPRRAVEGGDIVPDREPWQDSIALTLEHDLSAVLVDFDGAYGMMAEKESAEDSSPCACK